MSRRSQFCEKMMRGWPTMGCDGIHPCRGAQWKNDLVKSVTSMFGVLHRSLVGMMLVLELN